MQSSFQRIRNLTSGILHTNPEDVKNDLGAILGIGDSLPHFMVTKMMQPVKDFLRKNILDQRFWDDKLDLSHVGTINISEPTDAELGKIWTAYNKEQS